MLQVKFYEVYELRCKDGSTKLVDGHEIRPFLDWTPEEPHMPRFAKLGKDKQWQTFLASELVPVEDTAY